MMPRPSRRRAQQVLDRELGLAEELVAAAVLQPDERAQQHPDRLRRDAADAFEVGLAVVGVEVLSSARRSERSSSGRPFSSA